MAVSEQAFKSWTSTRLWSSLSRRRTASQARHVLGATMPTIETILKERPSETLDFSLHDQDHSWRVAERMVDIAPTKVLSKLASCELALLLLSAYLHDIGMSPERNIAGALYSYLLTGSWEVVRDGIPILGIPDENERSIFDDWLSLNTELAPGRPPTGVPTPSYLGEVQLALTDYCRARHNDWSAEWIEHHLQTAPALYTGWLSDLTRLCRSHHEGYKELADPQFSPKLVPGTNEKMNLRYLACLLRVADVIEFDPERTPAVLFRHRDIRSSSRLYWWKDAHVAWEIERGKRLTVFARPPNAIIQRAIEETVESIERELRICRRLDDEIGLSNYLGVSTLPHSWTFAISVHSDIRAENDAYVYIDGSFRPNVRKLLGILGGHELYRNRLVAIRELLQNAFDAVREQVAWRSTMREGRVSPGILGSPKAHEVRLALRSGVTGPVLVCTDTGAGMTRRMIEQSFLVSGENRRSDIIALTKRCRNIGLRLERTGQFGIGILSYFLLAGHLHLRTRRSLEAGEGDNTGWEFALSGFDDFGELRRCSWPIGTEVSLKIHKEALSDLGGSFSDHIARYVRTIIRRAPCEFSYVDEYESVNDFAVPPGWSISQTNTETLSRVQLSEVRNQYGDRAELPFPITKKSQERMTASVASVEAIRNDMAHRLRWRVEERELMGGQAVARGTGNGDAASLQRPNGA